MVVDYYLLNYWGNEGSAHNLWLPQLDVFDMIRVQSMNLTPKVKPRSCLPCNSNHGEGFAVTFFYIVKEIRSENFHILELCAMPTRVVHQTNIMFQLTILISSGPLTEMKFIPVSLATALARSVLPHPGGPASRTPDGELSPRDLN